MPTGKVLKPDGPTEQTTLGTVEDTDGKTCFFLNTANLKMDEPVLFEIHPFDIIIDGENVKLKIATLERDAKGKPIISKQPWPEDFKAKWDKEWDKIPDDRILAMKFKKNGKSLDKKEILNMRESYMIAE